MVRNGADPRQVRYGDRRDREHTARWQAALRTVLATPAGQLVFGELEYGLLARAGVFRSVYNNSATQMAWNSGQQDFGLQLLAELVRAAPAEYLQMEAAMRQLAARDDRTTAAVHTPDDKEADNGND